MSDVLCLVTGPYKSNCFILHQAGEGVIIDPGAEAERIAEAVDTAGVTPLAIICTHGHLDHIGAVAALAARYGLKTFLHGADAALVRRANLYASFFKANGVISIPTIDADLRDYLDTGLTLGPFHFAILETPGHTDGGVCLVEGARVFTGDTLFARGHGGTKLPGGKPQKFEASLDRLRALDGGLTIYPGHGKSAVLADALKAPELAHA